MVQTVEHLDRVEADLRFIRRALDVSTHRRSPSALYFLWAAICLVGFVLEDFRAAWVPTYWSIAGSLGFIASGWLGWRQGRRQGQSSSAAGTRDLLHWGAVLAGVALAVWLGGRTGMAPERLHPVILLVLAIGYVTAGLHLDRPFVWVGLVMAAGFVVVTLEASYASTTIGLALFVALSVSGIRGGRSGEATA